MKKKGRWVKRLIILLVCVALALAAGLTAGANYLVDVGVARGSLNAPDKTVWSAAVLAFAQSAPYAEETITSHDGVSLVGREYVNPAATHDWVLFVHGHGSSSAKTVDIAQQLLQMGYNVLAPDMRAHGESGGAYSGMGWLERKDILQWIDVIDGKDADAQIALYGISMGAAAVMMTAGEALPANVACGIEDCGYTTVYDEFLAQMKQQYSYLPTFPLFDMASGICKIKAGYTFSEASSVKQLANCKIPMLFIHGDADTYVPFSMLRQVYDADANSDKQMLVVPGAGHDESRKVDPEKYWGTVGEFLQRCLY